VNHKYYLEVLAYLRKRVVQVGRKLQMNGCFELHHGSAPTHAALSVHDFQVKKCIPLLLQALGSLDLSPCNNFYLFPKLKLRVSGSHFQTLDCIQEAITDAIKTLTEADFQSCCEVWKIR
jgi:hypothetical protein